MTLHRRKNGWGTQLRIGKGRRPWFVIQAPRKEIAELREAIMCEMAALLVSRGRYTEVETALRQLAASYDQAEFDGGVEGIRELCAEPVDDGKGRPGALITFREFGERWTSGKLAARYGSGYFKRNKASVGDDVSRLKELCKSIGNIPLVRFTADDAYRAMENLPSRVKTDSTRKQYAQVIQYLLKKAANPCRIIERSPLDHGFSPKPSRPPKYPFLYPANDIVLCGSSEVEIGYRVLYGFGHREGGRKAYLALHWRDLDLDNGFVHGGISKTGEVLSWEMFPGTREALVAYRKGLGDPPDNALVFPPLSDTEQAKLFREHLRLAGITRPELFQERPGRGCIRFHDLRAGFITVALANDRTEAWIARRTGHTSSQMINRYRREAERIETLGDWAPLDVALGFRKLDDPPAPTAPAEGGMAYEVAQQISAADGCGDEGAEIMLKREARPVGFEPTTSGLESGTETARGTGTAGKQPRRAQGSAGGTPASHPDQGGMACGSQLSSEHLVELLDLARTHRRWHLIAPLGEALAAAERAKEAARPKVANLDAARRKRDRGES